MHLREGYVEAAGDPRAVSKLVDAAVTPFRALVTNVARDGAMAGPDVALMEAVMARRPDLAVQASGGVRSVADIATLKTTGANGAIVGRALYEGALDLKEEIRAGT